MGIIGIHVLIFLVFYNENSDFTMGCPLSGIMAGIFLNNIENKPILSKSNPFLKTSYTDHQDI